MVDGLVPGVMVALAGGFAGRQFISSQPCWKTDKSSRVLQIFFIIFFFKIRHCPVAMNTQRCHLYGCVNSIRTPLSISQVTLGHTG